VAETHSFAETARRLGLANSVISKRVKDLEDYLGVRLLHRTTRHLSLTEAGYQYFERTRHLLGELAEAEEHLRYQNENPVGELKVSAPVNFGEQFMGPAVSSFLEKYPDVSVRLFLNARYVDFVQEGYDLAIRIGKLADETLITRKLAQSRRVAVASPEYLEKNGRPETPSDLARHNCLVSPSLTDERGWPFQINGKKISQPVTGRFVSDNATLLCAAARQGCGITFMPTYVVGSYIMRGELEIILEKYEEEPLAIQAVFPHRQHMSARARKFIDHLSDYFAGFNS
jgi:DNA-binding transcriptional LysR family regulator